MRTKFNKVTKKNTASTKSYAQQFNALMKMFQNQMRSLQRNQGKFNGRGGNQAMNMMNMNPMMMFNQGARGGQNMMGNPMMPNPAMMGNPMMPNPAMMGGMPNMPM